MRQISRRERVLGGLWGAVVGDALGVPVEFTSREERRLHPVMDMIGHGSHNQPRGTWSDDSSLLLCTVEQLCSEYDPAALGALFAAWCQDGHWTPWGRVFDIGGTTMHAINRIAAGVPPEEAGGTGESSNGNGSLMRILPVGIRYAAATTQELLNVVHRVSGLTHRHPRSQMACGLYCLIARDLLDGADPNGAYARAKAHAEEHYRAAPFDGERDAFSRILSGEMGMLSEADVVSDGYVVSTLEASIWCLLTTSSFEEAVLRAVNLGSDTDTTGCVTGGLAGIHHGLDGVPERWQQQLARREDIDQLFSGFASSTSY